jgi:hypothetical protein
MFLAGVVACEVSPGVNRLLYCSSECFNSSCVLCCVHAASNGRHCAFYAVLVPDAVGSSSRVGCIELLLRELATCLKLALCSLAAFQCNT